MDDELEMKLEVFDGTNMNAQSSGVLDIAGLVSQAIPKLSVLNLSQVVKVIEDAGPMEPEDLLLLQEEDINSVLRPLQRRRLLNFFKSKCLSSTLPLNNCDAAADLPMNGVKRIRSEGSGRQVGSGEDAVPTPADAAASPPRTSAHSEPRKSASRDQKPAPSELMSGEPLLQRRKRLMAEQEESRQLDAGRYLVHGLEYWPTVARICCHTPKVPGDSLQVRYPDGNWYQAVLLPRQEAGKRLNKRRCRSKSSQYTTDVNYVVPTISTDPPANNTKIENCTNEALKPALSRSSDECNDSSSDSDAPDLPLLQILNENPSSSSTMPVIDEAGALMLNNSLGHTLFSASQSTAAQLYHSDDDGLISAADDPSDDSWQPNRSRYTKRNKRNLKRQQTCQDIKPTNDETHSRVGLLSIDRSKYKGNYCYFCSKKLVKVWRHYEQLHSKEPAVVEVLNLPKKCEQRQKLQEKLRKMGNHAHNSAVLAKGSGMLLPTRRSKSGVLPQDFVSCFHCKGLFQKSMLWLHERKCKLRTGEKARRRVIIQAQLTSHKQDVTQTDFEVKILNGMLPDRSSQIVINDKLIMKFGEHCYIQNPERHLAYQRQRLRKIAKVLMVIRDRKTGTETLSEVLHPDYFDVVVESVKEVAGYCEDGDRSWDRNICHTLRRSLKICSEIQLSEASTLGDECTRLCSQNFLGLLQDAWRNSLSQPVLRNHADRDQTHIRLATDVVKFNEYLDKEIGSNIALLRNENITAYGGLSNSTFISLVLYNMRQKKALQRITVVEVVNGLEVLADCSDIKQNLCPLEALTLSSRLNIKINVNDGTALLIFRKIHVEAMKLLIEYRSKSNVKQENKYFFSKFQAQSLSPADSVRQIEIYADKLNLQLPHIISSAKHHRQVATLSQIFSFDGHELEQLSEYLSQTAGVVLDHKRLPSDIVLLARVCRILIALEDGLVITASGQSLEDITFEDDYDTVQDDTIVQEEPTQCNSEEQENSLNNQNHLKLNSKLSENILPPSHSILDGLIGDRSQTPNASSSAYPELPQVSQSTNGSNHRHHNSASGQVPVSPRHLPASAISNPNEANINSVDTMRPLLNEAGSLCHMACHPSTEHPLQTTNNGSLLSEIISNQGNFNTQRSLYANTLTLGNIVRPPGIPDIRHSEAYTGQRFLNSHPLELVNSVLASQEPICDVRSGTFIGQRHQYLSDMQTIAAAPISHTEGATGAHRHVPYSSIHLHSPTSTTSLNYEPILELEQRNRSR